MDITDQTPKLIDPQLVREVDVVVTLGREARVEHIPGARFEIWDTDEPSERHDLTDHNRPSINDDGARADDRARSDHNGRGSNDDRARSDNHGTRRNDDTPTNPDTAAERPPIVADTASARDLCDAVSPCL